MLRILFILISVYHDVNIHCMSSQMTAKSSERIINKFFFQNKTPPIAFMVIHKLG